MKYTRFSPRKLLNERFRKPQGQYDEEYVLHFLRWGRGMSFHEFELAMDRIEQLNIVSSLTMYIEKNSFLRRLKRRFSIEHKYETLLSKICPTVNKAFYQPMLNLVIQK